MYLTTSSCKPFDSNPPEEEHSDVVIDMEKSNLVVLFTKYEENCVKKFNKF